jgi:NADH dehydrogenase
MPQTAERPRSLPHVVIIGAGFGGLEAARALSGASVEVTLLDRSNHHLFQPLLYQVATAALSPGDIAWPVRSVFRRSPNVRVLMAEVTGIDPDARLVTAGGRSLPYDWLVLATGATHAYFGRDDWAAFAPGLKTIEDATDLRRRLLLAFEQAELAEDDPEERRRLLSFVVIGGGPTGVEMAGAIAELARHTLGQEFRRIDPRQARIVLIEAGPRLLPSFPEKLALYAHRVLEAKGVQVRTGTMVTGCGPEGVECGTERIAASSLIWAAGVKASPAAAWLTAERDRAGRIKVAPDLGVPGHPGIFAIGDTAAVTDREGRPVPGTAPAAKQMGHFVGELIAARIKGRTGSEAGAARFAYRHQGELATIGRLAAVVKLDRLELRGVIGWLFWGIAHVWFLIGFRSRAVVAFEWLWGYFTFQRGARLITRGRPVAGARAEVALPAAAMANDPGQQQKPAAAAEAERRA